MILTTILENQDDNYKIQSLIALILYVDYYKTLYTNGLTVSCHYQNLCVCIHRSYSLTSCYQSLAHVYGTMHKHFFMPFSSIWVEIL